MIYGVGQSHLDRLQPVNAQFLWCWDAEFCESGLQLLDQVGIDVFVGACFVLQSTKKCKQQIRAFCQRQYFQTLQRAVKYWSVTNNITLWLFYKNINSNIV